MKILRAEKFQPRKRNEGKRTKAPTNLRRTDWDVLMQHNRFSGKLDLKSKEFIKDPGSVKRLLQAEMIYPDGKLTPEAKKKCTDLARKLETSTFHPRPRLEGETSTFHHRPHVHVEEVGQAAGKQFAKLTASDWAVLVKYDRKTGNLLKYDPKTNKLDNTSRAILKDPAIIQRLIDNNMILPGGWLTPEAKKECVRIEQKLKGLPADGYSGLKAHPNPELQSKGERQSNGEQLSKGERQSNGEHKSKVYPERQSKDERPPKGVREPIEEPKKDQPQAKMVTKPDAKRLSDKLSKAYASRQHYPDPKDHPNPNPELQSKGERRPKAEPATEKPAQQDMQTFF